MNSESVERIPMVRNGYVELRRNLPQDRDRRSSGGVLRPGVRSSARLMEAVFA